MEKDFLIKNCCWVFRAKDPKWARNEVFQDFGKIGEWNFYDFLIKLQQHEVLKVAQMNFFITNLILRFFGQKRPEISPKGEISGIMKYQCIVLFWTFLHKVTVT